jgi:hypothetical protein
MDQSESCCGLTTKNRLYSALHTIVVLPRCDTAQSSGRGRVRGSAAVATWAGRQSAKGGQQLVDQ